jgi:hypothetical protein
MKQMPTKVISVVISVLLLCPLFIGIAGSSQLHERDLPSFQKPCHIDSCFPHSSKCPLCTSSTTFMPYHHQQVGDYLPTLSLALLPLSDTRLSDQDFVKSIFRPPTSSL